MLPRAPHCDRALAQAAGPEALLHREGKIKDCLGKIVTFDASSGKELREKYEEYVGFILFAVHIRMPRFV